MAHSYPEYLDRISAGVLAAADARATEKSCDVCRGRMVDRSPAQNRLYCSDACKMRAHRRRDRERYG